MTKRATRQDALQVLRLLNLFNEKEIYGLVLDYLFTTCTISPDMPCNPWNGAAGGIGVRDIVGGPAFSRDFVGARFCFTIPATFEQLRVVDIGLTTRSEPFNATDVRGYICEQEATFFTTENYEPPLYKSSEPYTVLKTVHHQFPQGNQQQSPKCSVYNTLAYAEIIYQDQKMSVNLSCIDHVTKSLMFLTRSMDIPQEFHCCPLYPFLSLRIPPPFAISIHSIL